MIYLCVFSYLSIYIAVHLHCREHSHLLVWITGPEGRGFEPMLCHGLSGKHVSVYFSRTPKLLPRTDWKSAAGSFDSKLQIHFFFLGLQYDAKLQTAFAWNVLAWVGIVRKEGLRVFWLAVRLFSAFGSLSYSSLHLAHALSAFGSLSCSSSHLFRSSTLRHSITLPCISLTLLRFSIFG